MQPLSFFLSRLFLLAGFVAGVTAAPAQVKVYGTATHGGASGHGSLFSVYSDGSHWEVLHNFVSSTDGYEPGGAVVSDTSSKLYGVVRAGGGKGTGILYAYDTATHVYQQLFDFTDSAGKGFYPSNNFTLYQHKLYGLTTGGGANNTGTLYSFDPATGTVTKVYDLPDRGMGWYMGPYAAPVFFNGKIYFSTYNGGVDNKSMLVELDLSTGTFTDLHDFPNNFFEFPDLSPVVIDSVLYGVSVQQIYSYDTRTGTYTDLYDFQCRSPNCPDGVFCWGITVSKDKKIYGTQEDGGIYGDGGVLFRFDPVTRQYTILHYFDLNASGSFNEALPQAAPLILGDTLLLGTTSSGITYSFNLSDSTYTRLSQVGFDPHAALYLPALPAGVLPQTITFANFTKTYGDADFDGGAVASSGLPVTYTSSDTTVATIEDGKIHITGTGTGHIIASQAGSANYAPATATDTLTIDKASLTITAVDTSIIYGLPLPPFRVNYDGFVYGEDTSALTVQPTVTALAARPVPDPGRYELLPSGAVSDNYAFNYAPGALTVNFPGSCLNAWMSARRILSMIIYASSAQRVNVHMFNTAGRLVYSTVVSVLSGNNYFNFNVSQLSSGLYFVRINGMNLQATQKINVVDGLMGH